MSIEQQTRKADVRRYLAEVEPRALADFINAFFTIMSQQPNLEVTDFISIIDEMALPIQLDSYQQNVDTWVLKRMLERRVDETVFHNLSKIIGYERAGHRAYLYKTLVDNRAKNVDDCLATFFDIHGKWFPGDADFEDLVWALERLKLLENSHVLELRLRLESQQRSDDILFKAFTESSEFNYVKQFSRKFGSSPSGDDLFQLQKLLRIKGFDFSEKELKRFLIVCEYDALRRDLEVRVFTPPPGDFKETVKRLFGTYGAEPSSKLLGTFAELLAEFRIAPAGESTDPTSLLAIIRDEVSSTLESLEIAAFEKLLMSDKEAITLETLDILPGIAFEGFLAELFSKMGYQVDLTKTSRDQGADLVLSGLGERVVVQAKRYGTAVGNKAVQEVVAAKALYRATKGIVVTNNYFTSSAEQLARANNVQLIDRKELGDLLREFS